MRFGDRYGATRAAVPNEWEHELLGCKICDSPHYKDNGEN